MAQINLLDSQNRSSFKFNGHPWIVRGLVAILILLVLFYGYLYFRQHRIQTSLNDVRNKTSNAQQDAITNKKRSELLTRQGQLAALNSLLKNHVAWSGLLPELARISLRQSTYMSIDAVDTGNLIVNVAMPTYADLDKYLQVFDLPEYNRQFSNVRVLSINKTSTQGDEGYLMRLQLFFNRDFIKSTTN